MPTTVQLPDGAHALLRDAAQVPERLRRPYVAVQTRMGALASSVPETLPEDERKRQVGIKVMTEQPGLLSELTDTLMLALISNWSYDMPVTADSLLDLPVAAYDTLKAACEKQSSGLMVSFEPTPDPDSPTEPSNG
ncbi:hypothetical protein D5S17_32770 [Pseudonocardiaceae bacterium YIM PH 21723]|nr:hypothetical protein D5S17_32770 [Pseudonocardiaceae bacterium YIM PH 21723]